MSKISDILSKVPEGDWRFTNPWTIRHKNNNISISRAQEPVSLTKTIYRYAISIHNHQNITVEPGTAEHKVIDKLVKKFADDYYEEREKADLRALIEGIDNYREPEFHSDKRFIG